jgi:ABC-2 type transport system ATP-binding protein
MYEYVLKTEALSKYYGDIKAVDNVSLNIKKGDIYGFVGKNGAGKTTIIRLISGLIKKTSGSFELLGVADSDDIALSRKRISGIVEAPSLYLNMNAYDNILMQMKVLGMVDEEKIEEILNLVDLDANKKSKQKAKNFSLGMKQRLGIAIALVGNPEFILLDEPTNGLDPSGIIAIRELLIKLNQEKGITFMISSHILSELSKLATTYGFIEKGKLIQEISARDLEKHSQKVIQLSISSTEKVPMIFEEVLKIKDYKIINNTDVNIYGEVDIAQIVSTLANAKISIMKIVDQNEDLESYFINLVGGKK